MKSLKLLLLLLFVLFSELLISQSASVQFRNDIYESALTSAQQQDKPIFIDTWAEWCGPCKKMEPVFRDPALAAYFNQHFVNVRIDMGQEGEVKQQVQRKYDIFFLPTLLILDKDGHVMFRSDNKVLTVDELLNIAQAINSPESYAAAPVRRSPKVITRPQMRETVTQEVKISEEMMLRKSAATGATVLVRRPDISDMDYSDDPNEKVLYTLGEGDQLPPEILYEEAYFRYSQFSDGSYRETVHQYLNSQANWKTETNVKFIFDFLMNTDTKQFAFMIENRTLFESILGTEVVKESIGIMVYQKLYQAVDRPNLERAKKLFTHLNDNTSDQKAYAYILNRTHSEGRMDEYVKLAADYLQYVNPLDLPVQRKAAQYLSEHGTDKHLMLQTASNLADMIYSKDVDYELHHYLAKLYLRGGKKGKAKKAADKAIAVAKRQNKGYDRTQQLYNLL